MLDTNQASYILKGKSPATRDRILSLRSGELACISAVTEAELLYGIAKSGIGEQRMRLLNWFLQLVAILPAAFLLWLDVRSNPSVSSSPAQTG